MSNEYNEMRDLINERTETLLNLNQQIRDAQRRLNRINDQITNKEYELRELEEEISRKRMGEKNGIIKTGW